MFVGKEILILHRVEQILGNSYLSFANHVCNVYYDYHFSYFMVKIVTILVSIFLNCSL